MYELEKARYARVQPLFAKLRYNLVIDSIIDGNTPTWVYVDDPIRPRTALMWNRQKSLLLAGFALDETVNAAIGELIAQKIIPDARQRYIPELSLHYTPFDWEGHMDMVLTGREYHKARRRIYTFKNLKVDWRDKLPSELKMRRIDAWILQNQDLENAGQMLAWVLSYWDSVPAFESTGFGYCLLDEQVVASWCLTVYASSRQFELGVATVAQFRNRGLATLTTAACLEHCLTNGYNPHWHSWEHNRPSIAVAQKVGFERPMGYSVYRFEL